MNDSHGSESPRRTSRGFDFTGAMRRLCEDVVGRLPEFAHIDLDRVAISFCQTRKRVSHGHLASLTPLRFENGATTTIRRGVRYRCQAIVKPGGGEYLYLLNFYLPRYLDHALSEKLSTVVHELWHIGPKFDGDLRRHSGRCYAHGASQKKYDEQMDALTKKWLALDPPAELYEFLRMDFRELENRYGAVYGTHVQAPKLVRIGVA